MVPTNQLFDESVPPNMKHPNKKTMVDVFGISTFCETSSFMWVFNVGMGQNPIPLVNPKIAGKWMFIPLKMVLIGIDP
jgi:hypothetical protein